jgi:D-threonine aldolase
LARRQAEAGHPGFTCATIREVEGMAAAGLGRDLLLANEVLDCTRLGALEARVTVAVDSEATIDAAASGGVKEVVIDVNIGMPRCGCAPDDAGRLADLARTAGLEVRGVMGYEGHVVGLEDRASREELTQECVELLLAAHGQVGGELISAGGTGTYDTHTAATEIQARSYALMDTTYAKLDIPFRQALAVLSTVISVNPTGYAVCNSGLKSLGMDHGNPAMDDGHSVFLVSDEHITFGPASPVTVGDLVRVRPAHVDPTSPITSECTWWRANKVLETWDVDLRGW